MRGAVKLLQTRFGIHQPNAFLERAVETRTVIADLQTQVWTIVRRAQMNRSVARLRSNPVSNRVLNERLQDQVRHLRVERSRLHVDVDGEPVLKARLLDL